MMASQNGNSEVVEMLLEGGADVNMQEEVREGNMVCFIIFLPFNVIFVNLVRMV